MKASWFARIVCHLGSVPCSRPPACGSFGYAVLEVSLLSFPSWVRSVFVMQRVAREFQEGVWARGASYPLTLASSLSLTSPPAPLVDEAQSVGVEDASAFWS